MLAESYCLIILSFLAGITLLVPDDLFFCIANICIYFSIMQYIDTIKLKIFYLRKVYGDYLLYLTC